MNPAHDALSNICNHFQSALFPWLQEELGALTDKQQQLIRVLEVSKIETHIPFAPTLWLGKKTRHPQPGYVLKSLRRVRSDTTYRTGSQRPDRNTLGRSTDRSHLAQLTAIEVRKKPEKKVEKIKTPKKRGRPKKGEERIKEPARLEKQSTA